MNSPSAEECPIFVLEPQSQAEIIPALKTLKERKTVILNLSRLKPHQARQAADLLAGCSCAIDGRSTWVDKQTYIFTPNNVQVTRQFN